MPSDDPELRVVEKLFEAMATGPAGEEPMMELFAEDAVFVEGFTGHPRRHAGKGAIRQTYKELFSSPPPADMELHLHRADRDGATIRTEWSCTSVDYEQPRRGYDLFRVEDGKIQHLEVVITQSEKRKGSEGQ